MDNVMTIIGNNTIFADTIQNFTTNPYRRVDLVAQLDKIGRAHVWTPVTWNDLVCRLLLEKKKRLNSSHQIISYAREHFIDTTLRPLITT